MKVVFRADASVQIGTGHVMRCLTLAQLLKAEGAECHFICRDLPGNRIDYIAGQGFCVHRLTPPQQLTEMAVLESQATHTHAAWLGCTQDQDSAECEPLLAALKPSWLIVDHYALDALWETTLAHLYAKLMVIDDLADRRHQCDLLLDQTFRRTADEYQRLVPKACTILCGSEYALLRPEFAKLRDLSLARRVKGAKLGCLLITMGGVDKDNATGFVLDTLRFCVLPIECRINVVMGGASPHLTAVQEQAKNMPWATEVLVDTQSMAQLMADSDLAIGAAGATSWERCCLGLPTIMAVLAINQLTAARALEEDGAVVTFNPTSEPVSVLGTVFSRITDSPLLLNQMSQKARLITDGLGTSRVVSLLSNYDLKDCI